MDRPLQRHRVERCLPGTRGTARRGQLGHGLKATHAASPLAQRSGRAAARPTSVRLSRAHRRTGTRSALSCVCTRVVSRRRCFRCRSVSGDTPAAGRRFLRRDPLLNRGAPVDDVAAQTERRGAFVAVAPVAQRPLIQAIGLLNLLGGQDVSHRDNHFCLIYYNLLMLAGHTKPCHTKSYIASDTNTL